MNIPNIVYYLLTINNKNRLISLFLVMVAVALLDVMGVASIMPLIGVMANPSLIEKNQFLNVVYENGNFKSHITFIFFLSVITFLLLVVSVTLKSISNYKQLHFTLMREFELSKLMMRHCLEQNYVFFLEESSANIEKVILSETSYIVNYALMPAVYMISQLIIALFLFGLLLIVDPIVSITLGSALFMSYFVIYNLTKKYLENIGIKRTQSNEHRFEVLSQALTVIKEVKLLGLEDFYMKRFEAPSRVYATNQAYAQSIAQTPRYILELLTFGGMIIALLIFIYRNNEFSEIIPIIALYAFAGYRLIPALQQVYTGLAQLRFSSSALIEFKNKLNLYTRQTSSNSTNKIEVLIPEQKITLRDIKFKYQSAKSTSIEDVCLEIPIGAKIGIVGSSGSGKSTLVDVILGLLKPGEGEIIVDGNPITNLNLKSWQQSIGYVPQQICLVDGTIAENIALGIEESEIDWGNIHAASITAGLNEFVINEAKMGMFTKVGDKGIRLSGGQRQRIAIARALYRKSKILILDEGTSALDRLTEQNIINNLINKNNELTMILITHRLGILKEFDYIYFMSEGKIAEHGTYDQLIRHNGKFSVMLKAN